VWDVLLGRHKYFKSDAFADLMLFLANYSNKVADNEAGRGPGIKAKKKLAIR
jgi:hypothetical protein